MAKILDANGNQNWAGVTLTGATQTLLLVSPPVSLEFRNAKIKVEVTANCSVGADQTSLIIRAYRGPAIGGSAIVIGAVGFGAPAAAQNVTAFGFDEVEDIDYLQYSLSATQIGGVGDGSCVRCGIFVTVM